MEFNSLAELKERVMPALRKKANDFNALGYDISIEDIWTFLKINKWIKGNNLYLNDIVNDILKLDIKELR